MNFPVKSWLSRVLWESWATLWYAVLTAEHMHIIKRNSSTFYTCFHFVVLAMLVESTVFKSYKYMTIHASWFLVSHLATSTVKIFSLCDYTSQEYTLQVTHTCTIYACWTPDLLDPETLYTWHANSLVCLRERSSKIGNDNGRWSILNGGSADRSVIDKETEWIG